MGGICDRCVICAGSAPRHGGLCCDHRYDDQPPCDMCVTPPAKSQLGGEADATDAAAYEWPENFGREEWWAE